MSAVAATTIASGEPSLERRLVPSTRLVRLAAVPMLLSLLAIWLPALLVPIVLVDVGVLLLALSDLPSAGVHLRLGRSLTAIQSVGRDFPVEIHVWNPGATPAALALTDEPPGEAPALPLTVTAAPGASVHRYAARCTRRGAHRFGALTARVTSRLGLWTRQLRAELPMTVDVYPDFSSLHRHGLQARADERRLPTRSRRRPGGESEFERLRHYVAGDTFRQIDWKASARRQGFISREFGQEINQNVIFLVDAGRTMTARAGELSAFDVALNAALSMAHTALRHGDRVGLLVYDSAVRAWVPPRGGPSMGTALIRATYTLEPSMSESDPAAAFQFLGARVRRRSLVVVLTTVIDEASAGLVETVVTSLSRRHLPLCVWLQDPEMQRLASGSHTEGPWVRAAAAELVGWRERSLADLRRRGALIVDVDPARLTPALLGAYLDIKARRLL